VVLAEEQAVVLAEEQAEEQAVVLAEEQAAEQAAGQVGPVVAA